MCNGITINGELCPYEVKIGPCVGNCNKMYNQVCPDTIEDEETEEEDE